MGAGQSSDHKATVATKTSYYELLEISRQATDEEIKKAYRRKALELHPDRNYGHEEAATTTFAEVQAAYEVLSDPQERAWYDSHESAILRGDDAAADGDAPVFHNVRVTTADDLARMVRKFNASVEFSDAPSGFFGFVRETFDQLAREEEIAASWENVESPREYPAFGHQDDGYPDVVKKFYAAWAGFATVKTFSWKDKYRLSEAPDRWYRRRMEQENNRVRQEARREFNDAVRSLVAFIRKRDPRYIPSTQTEAERQKALREAAAAQAARARAENERKAMAEEIPEWTKMREPEELEESSEEDLEEEVFECVACNKIFKSENQWEAHEKSKKHQKALRSLQQKMRQENANYDLDYEATANGDSTVEVDEEENVEVASDVSEHDVQDQHTDHDVAHGDLDLTDGEKSTSALDEDDDARSPEVAERPLAENNHAGKEVDESPSSGEEDYASLEAIRARLQSTSVETPSTADSGTEERPTKAKMGKAAQKRAKKAAATAGSEQASLTHQCEVCNAQFPSKTKLFQHIKDEGHAALKSASSGGAKGKKGKGKR